MIEKNACRGGSYVEKVGMSRGKQKVEESFLFVNYRVRQLIQKPKRKCTLLQRLK